MVGYSSIERQIAVLLSAMPKLKAIVKKFYQYIFYLIFGLFKNRYFSLKKCHLVDEHVSNKGDLGSESFFGYYDKSPINKTNEYIIYQRTDLSTEKLPDYKNPVQVVLLDTLKNEVINVFKSGTYNWQQGTKLQWISDYEFIFNSIDTANNYCAYIVDARKNQISRTISHPIYDVHNNIALSLCFDRLDVMRPDYGYQNHRNLVFDMNNLDRDGIFKIDLINNTKELIISLKSLKSFDDNKILLADEVITHKVNHIMIAPDGKHFIFLHRFFHRGRKYDRLFVSDISGQNLRLINDHEMVSHCCWYGSNKVISFMRRYNVGDKYYLIDIESLEIRPIGIEEFAFFGDGHPGVFNGKLLFDTYPDKSRMKQIVLHDLLTHETQIVGEFYESFRFYGVTRCDLHPKWSLDGKKIFFDSVHTGKRQLYFIKTEE